MDVAHPRVHHAPGEQPHVVARRPQPGAAQRQAGGEAEASRQAGRDQAQPLGDRQQRRPGEHEPVVPEGPQPARTATGGRRRGADPPASVPGRRPGPRPACARVGSIRRPNGTPDGQAVSQPRHWTQVSIERTNDVVGGRARPTAPGAWPPPGRGATAPPRRSPGRSGSAAGTARTTRRWPARRRSMPRSISRLRRHGVASGSRPGARRPVGSNRRLIRRCSVATSGVDRAASAAARRRGRRPTPTSATNRSGPAVGRRARGSVPRAQRPAVRRQARAGRRRRPGRSRAAWASTSSGWPSSRTHVVVPSHRTDAGRCSARDQGERVGVARQPPLGRRQRPGAQHHLGDQPERAERADEQPAQVEARHVLHRRPAGLHDRARRPRRTRTSSTRVAHRSPAQPAEPAVARPPARRRPWRPARRAAPRSGPPRPARRRGRPPVVPARTRTVMSAASTATTPAGGRTSRHPAPSGSDPAADVPLRPAADGHDRPGVAAARPRRRTHVDRSTGRRRRVTPTRPRGRTAGRRTGCPPGRTLSGWPRRRGRTPRAGGPGRRGRRARTAAA